jgi:hypothetical protein
VFACLLLALRCGVLNEDGTAIEWKEGHAMWAPCILSLTMEKFQRIDEKVLGKSLLSALPVELSSGQTVVLLPAVNVKNDGTLSKPNITDLWPLLDAFVSSIVTLVSPADDVPLQVTTTLYQSTYSSFLAQVEEQPGDGDADVVTDDAKRTTKKRRLNSTENGVSNDKVIEKTERTRKKRKPSPLSSPPTHPLPSKRVKRASLQQHVDTADGGSADSTTDKKTKRKSKRKRSTKSGKANKNKKATLKRKIFETALLKPPIKWFKSVPVKETQPTITRVPLSVLLSAPTRICQQSHPRFWLRCVNLLSTGTKLRMTASNIHFVTLLK